MTQDIDMRQMARSIGATINFGAGSVVFNKGDSGNCMYIVQSGAIEMAIGEKVIETGGPNEAIGFISMVDGSPRSSTARVKDACELTIIDAGVPLYGRRGAEFRHVHHGRDGAPHPRHEPGGVGRVLINPVGKRCLLNVRFAPKATKLLRRHKMTRCANRRHRARR